ncbi:MAG: LapA family protein [Gammaproteobacteria bacterium]|nr:LapA family protein [Rhodocyclaceae bacterium]MBU3908711.1 LapA family protein [Gammaproteobacteria bacterium]MBU3988833.1 LapA family protein [Gammaproteobacteria bacterium]MBU4004739.1 LapA family protein [Gammaproteobacteria bacterium]MBU4021342.1 LapA family protein [Gammaproteobacteria bacterium]
MQLIVILSIVVAIGGVSFALQNQMTVTVSFLMWRFDSSLAMVILVSLALGACVVLLASLPAQIRNRFGAARSRKQSDSAETTRRQLQERVTELENQLAAQRKPAAMQHQDENLPASSAGPTPGSSG